MSLSWIDKDGKAHLKQFLMQRSDIPANSKSLNESQFQAMATIEGIKRGSFLVNAYKNAIIEDICIEENLPIRRAVATLPIPIKKKLKNLICILIILSL